MSTSSWRLASYFAADSARWGRRRGRPVLATVRTAVRSAMRVHHDLDPIPRLGRERRERLRGVAEGHRAADQPLRIDEPVGHHPCHARQIVAVAETADERSLVEGEAAR